MAFLGLLGVELIIGKIIRCVIDRKFRFSLRSFPEYTASSLPFTWKVVAFCLQRPGWNHTQSGHLCKAVSSNLGSLHGGKKGSLIWSAPCLCCNASNEMPWHQNICDPSNFVRLDYGSRTESHNCRFSGSLALECLCQKCKLEEIPLMLASDM